MVPFEAVTNKPTHLVVGGENIPVAAGTDITVLGENGPFGTVEANDKIGVMSRADYDRKP